MRNISTKETNIETPTNSSGLSISKSIITLSRKDTNAITTMKPRLIPYKKNIKILLDAKTPVEYKASDFGFIEKVLLIER